jgi:hypothetical protein
MRAQRRRLPARGLEVDRQEQDRVIGEIAADARQILPHLDAQLPQLSRRSDARAHQHGR